jgi:hypothetical protein
MWELSEIRPHVIRYLDEGMSLPAALRRGLKSFGRKQSPRNIGLLREMVQDELDDAAALGELHHAEAKDAAAAAAKERQDDLLSEDEQALPF